MNSTSLDIRLAGADDFPFVGQDGHLSSNTLRRKLDEGDVFIAVSDSTPVGYLRVEFLWSRIPYIEIIRVTKATWNRQRVVGFRRGSFANPRLQRSL